MRGRFVVCTWFVIAIGLLFSDVAHGAIDFALHGFGVLLDLPAAVARAGVFDGQFEAWHSVPTSLIALPRPPRRSRARTEAFRSLVSTGRMDRHRGVRGRG